MNCLSIAGNVGRDAELRQVNTANGTQSVLSFPVAVKSNRKGDDGKYVSDWFDCSLWGNRAESLAQYIKKGGSVAVFGDVSLEQYQTSNGAGAKMKINVQNVTLLGCQQQTQQPTQAPQQRQVQPAQQPARQAPPAGYQGMMPQQAMNNSAGAIDFDDDLPF